MPPAKAIEDMVCKVAEQKWIEDKATGAICSAITKELPIPNCQGTLEKMWDKIVTMCPRGLAVEAGTLAVSFSDCGDASTDAVVKDVVPKTITAGSTTTITGSGSLKKDISGVPKVAVTLKAGLPASLETTTTTLKVTASNGDKLICVQIMTKAAAQSVSGSMAPALPLVSMPSVPSISMPAAKAIEDMVCKVAEQKWIEDKATGAICSAITKELPIPNCQGTLEKMWDKIVTMCPRGLAVEAGTLAVSFSDCGDASTD